MNDTLRIALVQLYSNGDCLYATTIAKQIKLDFPNCNLTWVIADWCKPIIENNPFIDNIKIINYVKKNDVVAFRKFKKKILEDKKNGKWNEVFITSNIDTNLCYYDGTIRGMILRSYPNILSTDLQPILYLFEKEIKNVATFSIQKKLANFKHVILWEYAPQSGQIDLDFKMVMSISKNISENNPSVCFVLSSANKFIETKNVFDASVLSIRENAALTHYCTLLIGCSSGITWLTTSTASKFLPMVQLLNAYTNFINIPSVDFYRNKINHNGLIELYNFNNDLIINCIENIIDKGFNNSLHYNQILPIQFKTTTKIVYNLLVYREFKSILKHFMIMKSIYGLQSLFIISFIKGFLIFPFKLIYNLTKKIFKYSISFFV